MPSSNVNLIGKKPGRILLNPIEEMSSISIKALLSLKVTKFAAYPKSTLSWTTSIESSSMIEGSWYYQLC